MCAQLLKEIEEEITNLLSDLLRIDTTNPPGNETEAAKYLAKNLEKDGFKCELFESAPERGSVVTRLKGSSEKPRLLLLSHLDVVAANPKEWSVHPFFWRSQKWICLGTRRFRHEIDDCHGSDGVKITEKKRR